MLAIQTAIVHDGGMTNPEIKVPKRARLTDAERAEIVGYFLRGSDGARLVKKVERIIAARITTATAAS
jgi:hypothetical protein